MVDSKRLLDDINNKIANRDIFKYNREDLVRTLILATFRSQYQAFLLFNDMNYVTQIGEQYRTIIKFIFSVNNESGEKLSNEKDGILQFSHMIKEFIEGYTPVRNYLDQCIVETRKIKYDEANELYYEDNYDEYSNYSRMIDKVKEFPSNNLKQIVLEEMGKYLNIKKYRTNVFKDFYFKSMMDNYQKICWADSEMQFDCNFGDFTYKELIQFCAALKLIADYYNYMILKDKDWSIECDTMIDGISKLADLSREKVELFLNYQTYDYEYQKDKLSLFQELIKINNKYYLNPMTISVGLLPIKMCRIFYDKRKYLAVFRRISNEKEVQMTNDIVKQLCKYDVQYKTNHIMMEKKVPKAEYDMLVFDNQSNNLYIFEFKWHFVGDGEREHKSIDEILESETNRRLEQNKYILEKPQEICDSLFEGKKVNKVFEILISQNFSGNTKHSMPIIDFETLKSSCEKYDSFEEMMKYFIANEYRKSIPVESMIHDVEIEGYKFRIYGLCYKNDINEA